MYVTPDGRIVTEPTTPGCASEAEVERRRSALRTITLSERQQEEDCSICLDPHAERAALIPACNHYFHNACMERWLEEKNACPLCQKIVAP